MMLFFRNWFSGNFFWTSSAFSLDFSETHSGMILIFLWTFSGLFLDSFWTFSWIFLNFSGFHVNPVDLSYWWIYFGPMYSGSNTRRGLRQVFTPRWIHFGSNAARFARALRPSAFGLRLVAGGLRAYTINYTWLHELQGCLKIQLLSE